MNFCKEHVINFGPGGCQQCQAEAGLDAMIKRELEKRAMTAERKEVMWCVDCGARFAQEEIKGWGCPKCGSQGVPCGCDKDTTVEVNWHELRILIIWAENWAHQCKRQENDDSSVKMPRTVAAIARRLQIQRPTFGHLTLSGEIAALPSDLAKAGIEVGAVESQNIAKPSIFQVNGPGAVGHGHHTDPETASTS